MKKQYLVKLSEYELQTIRTALRIAHENEKNRENPDEYVLKELSAARKALAMAYDKELYDMGKYNG